MNLTTGASISVFRMDARNVGDWWSPPVRYFPLKSIGERDLIGDLDDHDKARVVIVGGGGLVQNSREMRDGLKRLAARGRTYSLVAWGVGADTVTDRSSLLDASAADPLMHREYDAFDIVGTRIHSDDEYGGDGKYCWVPCASALHPAFLKLRDTKPKRAVGLYAHKRVPIARRPIAEIARAFGQPAPFGYLPRKDNSGADIEAKLRFLAQHEFIVTNSYHGVYWATLLGRKVVCLAFKNGLFTFRHRPSYFDASDPQRAFDEAVRYENALDECRSANISFYRVLVDKFGDF